MKVLLLKPKGLESGGTRTPERLCEHLGLGYIASCLRQEGVEVNMFDPKIRDLDMQDTRDHLLNMEFDIIGITIPYQELIEDVLEFIKDLRRSGMDKIVMVGGHPAAFYYEKLLNEEYKIDFVCVGEGEYTVPLLVKALEGKLPIEGVKGIAYRKNGQVVFNGYMELVENLDTLPFPARDNLGEMLDLAPALAIDISGSRGCSWARCTFCDVQSFYRLCSGEQWRGRSPQNIVDEIEFLISKYNKNRFSFIDDDFFGPPEISHERIIGFCKEIKKRNLNIKFSVLCNVRDVQEDMILWLKEVGLDRVFIGIETGVPRTLSTFNKGVSVDENKRAILKMQELGIWCRCGSIFIDPYTTMDELKENIEFWENTGMMSVEQYKELSIFKGTPLERKLTKENKIIEEGFNLSYDHSLDSEVRKINFIVLKVRNSHIMPCFEKIRKLEVRIIKTFRRVQVAESNYFMKRISMLKRKLFFDYFTEFLKRIVEDVAQIKETDIDTIVGELFYPYQKEIIEELFSISEAFESMRKRIDEGSRGIYENQ